MLMVDADVDVDMLLFDVEAVDVDALMFVVECMLMQV
jgi:hypothetical protein